MRLRGLGGLGLAPRGLAASGAPDPVAGDIIAARVLANGWVLELDILGFKPGGNVGRGRRASDGAYVGGSNTVQYDLDFGTVAPKVVLNRSAVSGFDATTGAAANDLTWTSYGTTSLRKAYSVGGAEQTNDETDNTTYVTIRLALNEGVMQGETLSLNVLADLYEDNGAGGSSATSNAVTGLSVTNNSTFTGLKPGAAVNTPGKQLLYTDEVFEVAAQHRNGRLGRMAAACVMTWTGATSGVTVTKTITAMTGSTLLNAAPSGWRQDVFAATLTTAEIATFTQAEQVNWTYEVRPFRGPKLVSSTDGEAYPTTRLQASIPFICDKNNTLRAWATVDPSGALTSASTAGCTSTDTEQTNTANCYQSVTDALAAGRTFMGRSELAGLVIYLRAGTYANMGAVSTNSLTAGAHWVTITHAPSTNEAGVIITSTAGQTITGNGRRIGGHLHVKDVTLRTLANSTANDNVLFNASDTTSTPSRAIWIDNCTVESLSTATTPSHMVNQYGEQYWTNNTISGPFGMTLGSGRGWMLVAGNAMTDVDSITLCMPFLANRVDGDSTVTKWNAAVTTSIKPTMLFCQNNSYSGSVTVNIGYFSGETVDLPLGIHAAQWLIENHSNGTVPALQMSGDGDLNPCSNIHRVYFTVVGERSNIGYNDAGTASIAKSACDQFCIDYQRFNKRDTFLHPVNGKQAARTGNWPGSHYVDGRPSMTLASQFGYSLPGANSDIGDFFMGVLVGNADFVDDQSGSANSGGGNYHLGPSSDAIGLVAAGTAMFGRDLEGTARLDDGDGALGVFEYAA